jgi:hypothetical protein
MAKKTYSEKLRDPRWQKKRLEIMKRDLFGCVNCGDEKSTLNVHHIAYHENPWDTPDNLLITLCETCHKEETEDLKIASKNLIDALKLSGMTSVGMISLAGCFQKDRGWTHYEPCYDILKLAVEDDKIWDSITDIFWLRLHSRNKGTING